MKFEISFNYSIKNEGEILEQLGCKLVWDVEEGRYTKDIEVLEELEQFQRSIQVLTNDDTYNLLLDFTCGRPMIYIDNKL